MNILENQYLLKSNGKIVEKVRNQYRTVGLINEFFDSVEVKDGHFNIYYDSSYLDVADRPSPILSLALLDDSGNTINWSYSITNSANATRNIRIITGDGNKPPYSISPTLFDSNLVSVSSHISVRGTISTGNPKVYNDSGYLIDLPLQIGYIYNNDFFITNNYSTKEALRFADMGSPAIRYIKSLNKDISLNTDPSGMSFNDSGDTIFIMGDNGDIVKQYDLSINFDISTAVDSGDNDFAIYSTYQGGLKRDIYLNPDQDRMFILSNNPDGVYQYDLDSPGQVRSAQFKSNFYQSTLIDRDTFISPDGTKMYTLGDDQYIYQYDLYDPYRISSSSRAPVKNYYLGPFVDQESVISYRRVFINGRRRIIPYTVYYNHFAYNQAICFSNDGHYLYTVTGLGYNEGRVRRYTLSEPWDISTITTTQEIRHSIGVGSPAKNRVDNSKQNGVWGIRISTDGTKLFLMSREDDYIIPKLLQYNMPTPYSLTSLSTLTYVNATRIKYLSEIPYEQNIPLYNAVGTLYAYTTINNGWNNYINGFEFDSDGSKYFISNHQNVFEFTSNNFDINGSALTTQYPIPELSTSTKSINLLSGDRNFYIQNNGIIYQYSLDSDLDISNREFSYTPKFFSVAGQEETPEGMTFTKDGSKMYITGSSTRDIHEYVLSIPFEIHSAVFNTTLDVSSILSLAKGLTFNPTETVLYVVGSNTVYSFNVKDPFNTSTFTGDAFNVNYDVNNLNGIRWNNNGKEFSVIGTSSVGIDTYETKNTFSVKPL